MKNVIWVFVLVVFCNSTAQEEIVGSVIYQLKSKSAQQNKRKAILEMGIKAMEQQQFELVFSKNESVFKQIEALQSDLQPDEIRLFKKFYSNDFYVKTKERIVYEQIEIDNHFYLLKIPQKQDWNLTNETKIIDAYVCYKAITYKEIERDGILKKVPIIAWYCPEIPFQFGPKNFYGLPGLILELHDSLGVFYASQLNLNQSNKSSKLLILKGEEKSEAALKAIKENVKKSYFLKD
uniref:GLPGLI family protein n=1 Tax=Flavobacterium sp. TaxID=239 RepID=UPI004049F8AF